MSVKFYKTSRVKKRIEESKTFAGTTPMEAELDDELAKYHGMKGALERLAKTLQHQLRNNKNVVGIQFNSISFTPILDPEGFRK